MFSICGLAPVIAECHLGSVFWSLGPRLEALQKNNYLIHLSQHCLLYVDKQDFSEVYERNLLGEEKGSSTVSLPLSSPPHLQILRISNVTFSQELFPNTLTFLVPLENSISFCIVSPLFVVFLSCPLDCKLFEGKHALYLLKFIPFSMFLFREWFASLEKKMAIPVSFKLNQKAGINYVGNLPFWKIY